MPSHPHVLGLDLPAHDSARVAPAEYVDLYPTEYRADAVVVLSDGAALTPLVLGPDRVPVITDHACEDPELVVLSAMAHGGDPRRRAVLDALVEALANVDQRHAAFYADTVFAALPQAAKDYLEGLMAAGLYEYQSDFVRRNVLQGRAEAGSRSLLAVLDARGIVVPDDAKARISNCTDYGQFEIWIRRAATAESFDDVFA